MIIVLILSAILFVILAIIVINNRIVAKKNQVAQAFGCIDVYLKKRFDSVPNLVSILKVYLAHEKEILSDITQLRNDSKKVNNPNESIQSSNRLTGIMSGLNLHIEDYPQLKADEQFSKLQNELADIEELISAARRAYNAAVTRYNNAIQMFPASIIAGIRKDKTQLLLEIPISVNNK